MIKASDAIEYGRSLLGTPYSTYDCINYIKKIIRSCPGGDSKYQTAGTNTLWRSRDLSNKRRQIDDAKPGEVVFKWKQQDTEKYPDGLGDFHHIGLITDVGTVLHSSSVKECVVETELDSKWMFTATHRLIAPNGGGGDVEYLYAAIVVTESSGLRLRRSPVDGQTVTTIPKGATVYVIDEKYSGWPEVEYAGLIGYCSADYLARVDPEPDPEPQPTPSEGTWGVFIPCESQDAALILASYFSCAAVIRREVRD